MVKSRSNTGADEKDEIFSQTEMLKPSIIKALCRIEHLLLPEYPIKYLMTLSYDELYGILKDQQHNYEEQNIEEFSEVLQELCRFYFTFIYIYNMFYTESLV